MEISLREFRNNVQQRKAKTMAQLRQILDLSWLTRKNYKIINTIEAFEELLVTIMKKTHLALDCETTGLKICALPVGHPDKDKIVGMSLSWERDQGIYIPFEHTCLNNLDKHYVLKKLKPILESKSIITHNGLFDGKVFYDEGIKLNITQDTMLMQFNLDSTVSKGSKGLKTLTRARYGYDVIELEDIFENKSDAGLFMYVEEEIVRAYACADTDHTFSLFMDMFSELLPGQARSYTLDIRTMRHLIRSEYNGKGIDVKLLPELYDVYLKDIDTIRTMIYTYVGVTLARNNGLDSTTNMYRFNISSGPELGNVLFGLLKFPIPEALKQKQKISLDKYTLKALGDIVVDNENEVDEVWELLVPENLQSAIVDRHYPWVTKKASVLIDKKKLAGKRYKLIHLISLFRKLEKLRSSFFEKLIKDNTSARYYSGISMTAAETARLIDFIQTLDKSLKRLIVPYVPDDDYLMDYDMAQIEYRTMIGESGMDDLRVVLENPEADYHREGGSLILGKDPCQITQDERSSVKAVNFAIPYGMGEFGVLQNRYGIGLSKTKREEKLAEIRVILKLWNKAMVKISTMLNKYRDQALVPVSDETLPKHLKGRKMGRIANALGRTRLFDLSEMSKQKASSIRRQAGNYPIQSFAREIFCEGFDNLMDACIREGLVDIEVPDETRGAGVRYENLVVIMAYIHDECLMSVNKKVNPYFMYKLIRENAMIRIPGHPMYYAGINVITNWYEGKDDKYEAPVAFVDEMVAANPSKFIEPTEHRDNVLRDITAYINRRITREMLEIDPKTQSGYFDLQKILPKFTNYFVVPKVETYLGLHDKVVDYDDIETYRTLAIESFALYNFKNVTLKALDGSYYSLSRDGDYVPYAGTTSVSIDDDSESFEMVDSVFDEEVAEEESVDYDYFLPDEDVLNMFETEYTAKAETTLKFGGD